MDVAPGSFESLARAGLPDLTKPVRVRGADAPFEIFRDEIGVPHVRARSSYDAFFAQGFAHAQDRLWQMEYDRYRAAGRISECIGRAGLTYDIFMRRMGLNDAARADYEALDDAARGVLDAYAGGVTAYIDSMRAPPFEMSLLGISPGRWRGEDCIAIMKSRHVLMGSMHLKLWRARVMRALGRDAAMLLGAAPGRDEPVILPPGGRFMWKADTRAFDAAAEALGDGSNNWVVHGARTASGLPLMAGDPHRLIEMPNVYHQIHIACPEFDAIGISMPGIPGLFHFGHNANVAWCITHAMADNQDLYVERFDEAGNHLANGEWLGTERHKESIAIRGESAVEIDVTVTRHGPVLFGDPRSGSAIAMRWTASDRVNTQLSAIVPMLRALRVEELDDSMRPWVDPCNNFLMADREGSIAYLHRGRVPIRGRENGWTPVPGWTDAHEWTGDIAFEKLPRALNPDAGYIATANNRIIGDEYPHYLGMDYSPPNRANRLVDRSRDLKDATRDDMRAMHADTESMSARVFIEALRGVRAIGVAGRAHEILLGWNGAMDRDGAAPAIYAATRDRLAAVLLEREPLCALVENPYAEEPLASSAHSRVRSALPRLVASDKHPFVGDDALEEALERATEMLGEAMGPNPWEWRWDRVHTTLVRHPLSRVFPEAAHLLDPPAVGMGGDGECVWAGSIDTGVAVQHSSVARYVFDVSDWDSSEWVVPHGSSGHPLAPHRIDQQPAWSETKMHPMTYGWARVEREAESRQLVEPR